MKYDVVIIGAGIIGSLMSDYLAQYDIKVAVLEKNRDSGLEQSMSSSAIVHSGIDPEDGTLKAELNVLGNRLMPKVCASLDCEYANTGGYICATDDEQVKTLEMFLARAKSRGIEADIIDREELIKREPNVAKDIIKALSMPTTGVIYPTEITIAALERSMLNGVEVVYNTQVSDITYDDHFMIKTNEDVYEADYIINCAGVYAGQIAKMVDASFDVEVKAKRGEYYVTNNVNPIVSSVIYPTPTANGKGVLAVPTTHKNVLIGPNGVYQDNLEDDATHREDLDYVYQNSFKILDHFPTDIIKTYSGLRSAGNNGDFYLKLSENEKMVNAVCIDSPGIASAPAIVKYMFDLLGLDLAKKDDYIARRGRYLDLKKLSLEAQNDLIATNEDYGKIICRCEQVTKGEIIDSINKVNGARDLTGIKFRVRPMLGMCQGGFCEAEVLNILATTLGVEPSSIRRRGADTVVIKGDSYDTI